MQEAQSAGVPSRRSEPGGDEAGPGAVEMDEDPVEAELRLPKYEGTFSDYSSIVIQYGYITMFISAFPAVVFLAMMEVLLQIRTDR